MTIEPIEYTLKDGRKVLIRSPRDEDIPGMLDYLRVSAGETEFILRYPEECGKYTAASTLRKGKRPCSTGGTPPKTRRCSSVWWRERSPATA